MTTLSAKKFFGRLWLTARPLRAGAQAVGARGPAVEAGHPCGGHGHQVATAQGQDPDHLHEPQVVADADPDSSPAGLEHRQAQIAGLEAVLLLGEQVQLAVVADHTAADGK